MIVSCGHTLFYTGHYHLQHKCLHPGHVRLIKLQPLSYHQVQAYIATYSSSITGLHISRVDNHEYSRCICECFLVNCVNEGDSRKFSSADDNQCTVHICKYYRTWSTSNYKVSSVIINQAKLSFMPLRNSKQVHNICKYLCQVLICIT